MAKFGNRSRQQLATCHKDIKRIMDVAIALDIMDFSIIEGHRNKEDQNKYYRTGRSKVKYPHGKHNEMPSSGVDVAPFINGKISWEKVHCIALAYIILTVARMMGVNLRWGGNWDMDYEPITDQDFQDLVHFEIV